MKKRNCPSRWSSRPRSGRRRNDCSEAGYILLIVMMMATLLLISLAAALPSIYVEGQREKEKELIFRGQQYARAIMLFHDQFKRYPASVKELLHTDNLSFLRRAYPDPMSRAGKWRFIHATATGIILDSKILAPPGKQNKPPGSNSNTDSQSESAAQTNSQAGQGSSQQGGFSMGTFSLPNSGQNSTPGLQQNNSSPFFGQNQTTGAFIVGVASTSNHQSIGIFNKRTEYDEWEFLGIPGAPGAPVRSGAGAIPIIEGQPGQSPLPGAGSQPNSQGGFHLGPSPSDQPSQPDSMFGGNSNQ